ncbi:hypothetical protein NQ317_012060 [Molorchus minor]|uniref:Uncharacterized protein n=1 Tax=Molorchus minor TaxID=1323400 RepID=A0ABQ9K8F9_9CUCU|nr:hypothetical protein NQ317_012060 [Molorchus minor]
MLAEKLGRIFYAETSAPRTFVRKIPHWRVPTAAKTGTRFVHFASNSPNLPVRVSAITSILNTVNEKVLNSYHIDADGVMTKRRKRHSQHFTGEINDPDFVL